MCAETLYFLRFIFFSAAISVIYTGSVVQYRLHHIFLKNSCNISYPVRGSKQMICARDIFNVVQRERKRFIIL